jgi:uncharacterized repeat protein (TIGR03803 family)
LAVRRRIDARVHAPLDRGARGRRRALAAAWVIAVVASFLGPAWGEVPYQVLHNFASPGGPERPSSLTLASDGKFYGVTAAGGAYGMGSVFVVTPTGTLTTLHSFAADCGDGCVPNDGLIQATDGNLYGTTAVGGAGFFGTVFRITTGGTLTTLYSFPADLSDGSTPVAGLIQATDGHLYGTTFFGGAGFQGTVFRITTGGTLTTLHSFADDCSDGCAPQGRLLQASDGNLYGPTRRGGLSDAGTIFRITTAGLLVTLHQFGSDGSDGGFEPAAGLIQATDGKLYGTTNDGGPGGQGTVFSITLGGTLTTLHAFAEFCDDGCIPEGGLVQASDGNLYGTTSFGGTGFFGTIFKLTTSGALTTLHAFASDCTDGCLPSARLIQAANGTLYGTTEQGGAGGVHGRGTIFGITTGGVLSSIHLFESGCPDGCRSFASLMRASDGALYGTTRLGGAGNGGTIFKMSSGGEYTVLHAFAADCSDGCGPVARLVQAHDGHLYGTTEFGGAGGVGTVFRITTGGTLTTLYSFPAGCEPGCAPQAGLVQASDGNLYGTTSSAFGTIFRITTMGTLTTLHTFETCDDGCLPNADLVLAGDGNLWGTTEVGGTGGYGTAFKISPAGRFTTVHAFGNGGFDCNKGCFPRGLVPARDGNLYGTADNDGGGLIFKMTLAGIVTPVHAFPADCSEGCVLPSGLIQASDGNFYGKTASGGSGGQGTVFRVTPDGVLTTLHPFAADCSEGCGDCSDSCVPDPGLVESGGGNLYGAMKAGGSGGGGVVFRLATFLLSGAKVWLGLKNSDDVGLRLDVLVELLVDGTAVAAGQLENVSGGSSGFGNAILNVIHLARVGGPVDAPPGAEVGARVSVRRTCSGAGHASGVVRLWYGGQPIDAGAKRDAGTRVAITLDEESVEYFLRGRLALSTTPGPPKQFVDVGIGSKEACPRRTFTSFGTWTTLP